MPNNIAKKLHICHVRAKLLIVITLFVNCSLVNSENLVYKFLTIKEGLPSNNIFKLKFDHKGFLWIAHDNGISRYDGFKFKHYIGQAQKSNVYTDLAIAPDGKVWMTNLGLQVYYIENDEMKLFKSYNLNHPPSSIRVSFLNNGNLIVNAEGGIIEFDFKTGKEHKTLLNTPIQNFAINNDKVYFNNIGIDRLYIYKDKRLDSINLKLPFSVIYANDSTVISCYNVANFLTIRYGTQLSKEIRLPLNFNFNHSEQFGDYLYVFTTGSIEKVNLVDGKFTMTRALEGRSYTHYNRDKLGNEWYSTLNEGIVIKPYSNVQMIEPGANVSFIRLVNFKGNAYGITDKNQLYKILPDHLEKVLEFDDYMGNKPIILAKNLNDRYMIIGNSKFLLLDSNLKIKDYFKQLALKDASLNDGGNIYLATTGNILYHDFNETNIDLLAKKPSSEQKVSILKRIDLTGRFNCVKYDPSDITLYFGGVPGLFKMKAGNKFEEIKNGDEQIFSSFIDVIHPYVLVGSIQSGLYILKNGSIHRHFNNFNSTLGNTIIKTKFYNDRIWVLSNKGIHTIDPKDFNIQTFTYIGAVELNRNTDFTLAHDVLFLLSGQKTYQVNLSELRKAPPIIPVFFNALEIGNRRIFDLNALSLNYDDNSFSIEIQIPAASVQGNVEYEYSLNNINWFQLGNGQDKIYLSQLSNGNYTLNLRQIGIPKLYSLKFKIRNPYWKEWWFFFILVIMVIAIIGVIYLNRINNIRQKSVSELEKFKLEKALQLNVLSSIRSQMNPHFIFNALNTIQSYIYLNDKKQAINYLGKFSVLTRKVLEESNRETITLAEEMETLDLYLQLEKMRFENVLEYFIELDNVRFPEQFKIPPMLLQPYVENAVKHGLMHKVNNRKLRITFKFNDDQKLLEVQIDDNGIGRKRSFEINSKKKSTHKSFSTEANKTRLDILNSHRVNPISVRITDKVDEYNNPLGTLVQINIPVL